MRLALRLHAISAFAATAVLFAAAPARAQLELPRPSPGAKVTQRVGLTDITVDYSSPGVKGRKIWGELVPYDKMWRTGANTATKITFSKDVTFGGQKVPAGTYALFTIPSAKGPWIVILNKNPDQAGTGRDYKKELDVARIEVKPQETPMRERMTFLFSNFTDDATSLDLEWEKLRVPMPIKVDTAAQAQANVQQALDGTWRIWANAARYTFEDRKDPDTALKYIDTSISLHEDWFNDWIKAQILHAKGNNKDAYARAEKANELGKKAENFFFADEVGKALKEWKKK